MNDNELAARLVQLGCSPGPITDTTRSVWTKKLAKLEKEERGNRPRPRPAGTSALYSSGESDVEPSPTVRRRTQTRTSNLNGNFSARRSSPRGVSGEFSDSEIDLSPIRRTPRSTATVTTTVREPLSTPSGLRRPLPRSPLARIAADYPDSPSSAYHHSRYQSEEPVQQPPSYRHQSNSFSHHVLPHQPSLASRLSGWFGARSISSILVLTFVLAFTVLGGIYVKLRWNEEVAQVFDSSKASGSGEPRDVFPVCGDGEEQGDCIPRSIFGQVQAAVPVTIRLLSEHAGISVWCPTNEFATRHVSLSELEAKLVDNGVLPSSTSESGGGLAVDVTKYLALLFFKNPHWRIKALESPPRQAASWDSVKFLESEHTPRYLWCYFKSAITSGSWSLLYLATFVALVVFCVRMFLYEKNRRAEEENEVFLMVEEIGEILRAKKGGPVSVFHLRDQLIPAMERKAKKAIWEKVKQFITEHESRITQEVKNIAGEETACWCWSGPAPTGKRETLRNAGISDGSVARSSSPLSSVVMRKNRSVVDGVLLSPRGKPLESPLMSLWQGEAFNAQEPKVSPTSCLKIKNMYHHGQGMDPDIWPQIVRDAILERCQGIPIWHIAVDPSSPEGLVYLHCPSQTDAGKVFRILQGSWFAGHLISVKYLREERYAQRFPDSKHKKEPMDPQQYTLQEIERARGEK
ncbi:unnamed protein product [Cyprideis torosa]|uniref:Uncharacterized protein n=1 Tax=Cyprideis torosa TaxID=163714 RepID=A0A7R8WPP9_9CRUS|nr:unnamed protein product [Cyprideis torosa]CAG0901550.1 unnamed protein product [Cyprideis torosa]